MSATGRAWKNSGMRSAGSSECVGLAYPPADFAAFGDSVLRTGRITRLLDGTVV